MASGGEYQKQSSRDYQGIDLMDQLNSGSNNNEEMPPILGSWNKIYVIVVIHLFVLICLFYFFSETYQ
jgi:hypothetical protein